MKLILSNCLSIILNILQILALFLYLFYQNIVYFSIELVYLQHPIEYKVQKFNDCVNYINTSCNNVAYDISWKCIEVYTIVKESYKKNIIPNFHLLTNNYFKKEIILVKDGDELYYLRNWEDYTNHEDKNIDIILYTKFNDTENKKNYTVIGDNKLQPKNNMHEEKCSISFIIFQLAVNNNKYDINLKEPFNFLLKNNTLKHSFFKWYMKKIYDVTLELDNYSVNYMTQDMTISNLNSPFFIKFNEDSITSFSSGKPKQKQKMEIEEVKTDNCITNEESNDEKEESNDEKEESNDEKEESNDEKEEYLDEERKNMVINDIVKNEKLKRRTRAL